MGLLTPHRGTDARRPLPPQSRLRVIQIAVLAILIGFCGIGRRWGAWPLVTWPMYSKKDTVFPPRETAIVELRVTGSAGGRRTFTATDFLPMGYTGVIREVIDSAFGEAAPARREEYRAYLAGVIQRAMATDRVEMIEAWQVEWIVDPRTVPPFDHSHPARETRLGGFAASQYLTKPKAG